MIAIRCFWSRRYSKTGCAFVAIGLLVGMTVTLRSASARDCKTIEGFSIQAVRGDAATLAITMRDGMLLKSEPGIVAITHQSVACSNDRQVWRCTAATVICWSRKAVATKSTNIGPDPTLPVRESASKRQPLRKAQVIAGPALAAPEQVLNQPSNP